MSRKNTGVDVSLRVRTYSSAQTFLEKTQKQLESDEAANSLVLGICGQLVQRTRSYAAPPCLKTVEDKNGLVLTAVMTPPHKLVVHGHRRDPDQGSRLLVEDLVTDGRRVPGILGPRVVARRVADRWTEATGQGTGPARRLALRVLTRVNSPVPPQGRLRAATDKDAELVARWSHGFKTAVFGEADRDVERLEVERRIEAGDIFLWVDEAPVSMAMVTRPTRNGISVSLVYSPPGLRGRGYASACVGELCRLLLSSGRSYCALFADLENAAANRVYHKVGFETVCEYDEYAFLQGHEGDPASRR